MSRILRPLWVVTVLSALSTAGLAGQDDGDDGQAAAEERTTSQGVFSADQAARGEEVMWNICSECHVDEDFGAAFLRSWDGATVAALLEEIKSTMPEDNPGGMPDREYVDVIAYMFKLNGLPAGDAELEHGQLETIKIDIQP